MEIGIVAAGGIGVGIAIGFLVATWVSGKIIPQVISAVGMSLLNPGSTEVVEQPPQMDLRDLMKDLTQQMEPEPLPKDLDWMADAET